MAAPNLGQGIDRGNYRRRNGITPPAEQGKAAGAVAETVFFGTATGAVWVRLQSIVLQVHLPTFSALIPVPLKGIVRNASTLLTAAETPAATAFEP